MRPVVKGPAPQPEYKPYGDALDDLAAQLGLFCSYCEQPITHAPEIEHVQPKSLEAGLEFSWENFLLGCKSCNTVKGNTPVDVTLVGFPDMDNTFRGLDFHSDGKISIKMGLEEDQTELMSATVRLIKLHRHPSEPAAQDRPTRRDKRAELRRDVWEVATYVLGRYQADGTIADLIAEHLAPAKGFFSVWMTVFADHPEMLNRFIDAFPGTARDCFNEDGQSQARPGGRL
ncbi:HNH endonuclease [Cognatishimia sp. D5M38]|uniref:HNH endonuclease n=1 Tax=Cognatishimia coralii TaxID=3083254 RepID=A0ABU8QHL1_9RHOB